MKSLVIRRLYEAKTEQVFWKWLPVEIRSQQAVNDADAELSASMNPEILAGVCFYATDIHKGSLGKGGDNTLARMKELKAEMLMIWGRQDPHVPTEGRALIQKTMIEAGVHFTSAFCSPSVRA